MWPTESRPPGIAGARRRLPVPQPHRPSAVRSKSRPVPALSASRRRVYAFAVAIICLSGLRRGKSAAYLRLLRLRQHPCVGPGPRQLNASLTPARGGRLSRSGAPAVPAVPRRAIPRPRASHLATGPAALGSPGPPAAMRRGGPDRLWTYGSGRPSAPSAAEAG